MHFMTNSKLKKILEAFSSTHMPVLDTCGATVTPTPSYVQANNIMFKQTV